jgi:hypothetical protein
MAAKLTRLTHKIPIELHPVAESSTIVVPAPGGQFGNFWIYLPILIIFRAAKYIKLCITCFLPQDHSNTSTKIKYLLILCYIETISVPLIERSSVL